MSKIDDVLALPETIELRLLNDDMLVARNIVPEWREELIEISENIKRWKQSGQIRPNGSASYRSTHRTSRSFMISHQDPDFGPCMRRFEEGLLKAFHTVVRAYKERVNSHVDVSHDSGYEMLRYQEGEQFGLHTDAILGRQEGFRQLSGLLYLNDNYVGGETYFPRQKIKFKGTAGDLLLFPSTFCYPHESLPVTQGTKYAVVTWFIAYPKIPEQTEVHDGEQGEGGSAEPDTVGDGGLRLHGSAGGGSAAGEPQAPDREHPACVGGRAEPGAEA